MSTAGVRAGRFVCLRHVRDLDRPFLYSMATDPLVGARWRFRGVVPRPEAFERLLWEGVLAQFVIEGTSDGIPRGVVTAYSANMNSGTANVAVALSSAHIGRGFGVEASYLFCDYLFATWSLRKLYFEAPAFNCAQFQSAIGRFLHVEGVLRDHEYYGGRYWDSVLMALYREDVERFVRTHPHLAGSTPRVDPKDHADTMLVIENHTPIFSDDRDPLPTETGGRGSRRRGR